MRYLVLAAFLFFVQSAGVRAQTASYTPFGGGCLATTLTATGVPRLGGAFTVHYAGSSGIQGVGLGTSIMQPILLTGASNTTAFGVPLPWSLPATPFGIPCALLVSPDVVSPAVQSGSTFATDVVFQVPNTPVLLGAVFHQQWVTWQRIVVGASVLEESLRSSNGATGVIGT